MVRTFIVTGGTPEYLTDKLNSKLYELNINRANLIEIKFIQEQYNKDLIALVIYNEVNLSRMQDEITIEKNKS